MIASSKIALVTLFILASGCATSKQMQGPNGGTAYFIKCGSAALDACYAEATKVCPSGYTFADRVTNAGGMAVPVGASVAFVPAPHTMLVECRP